ncbi:MAG: MATE family efflux transporter [Acidimicrobiia bacterium]|jgi:Na+-driven multidrug efflux pump
MLELGTVAGVAAGVLVLLGRPVLPDIFSNDAAVLHLAGFLLLFVAVLQPVNGAVFVLDGLLIGAGDMAFLAKAMVAAALLTAPVAVAVAVLGLGIGWVWGAIAVLQAARLGVLALRWRSGAWAVVGAER